MSSFFAPCPSGNYNICKLCNAKIKCRPDGSACHINRHIKLKHPDQLSKFPKLSASLGGASKMHDRIMSSSPDQISLKVGDLKLIHPFSLIISGPTSSGKSTVLFQILENLHQSIDTRIQKVVFIYGTYQEVFENYPNIYFTDNLEYMVLKPTIPTIIVLDDVMSAVNIHI